MTDPGPRDLAPLLEPILRKHSLPALAAVVVRSDQIVAQGAVGVRRAGAPERVRITDRFHIGSNTKAMTATVCAMLVEEEKIKWTTTLAEVFPQLAERMDPAYRAVTLDQLLTHRGGLPGDLTRTPLWAKLWAHRGPPQAARQLLLEELLTQPPQAPPGTQAIYSNAGYAIAGHIIERIEGRPWETVMNQRLFKPLEMTQAGFGAPGKAGKLDQPRGHNPAGKPVEPGPQADNPPAIAPAGAIHCPLPEYARFIAMHLPGAQADGKLLRPESFKRLHSPAAGSEFAMGWLVVDRPWAGGKALTHAGSNTMWFVVVWMAPQRDLAVIVATNAGSQAAAQACDEVAGALIMAELKQR